MLERATRECSTSPQMATMIRELALGAADRQRVEQRLRRMFMRPSPALTTEQATFCASSAAAPAEPWRTIRIPDAWH